MLSKLIDHLSQRREQRKVVHMTERLVNRAWFVTDEIPSLREPCPSAGNATSVVAKLPRKKRAKSVSLESIQRLKIENRPVMMASLAKGVLGVCTHQHVKPEPHSGTFDALQLDQDAGQSAG